ncbi:hypothetical protein KY310_02105 [Candidatus Woesearchaeota archaeon]|nr:hypothetical protein [Candidatus Woesearchaeota archaeon]
MTEESDNVGTLVADCKETEADAKAATLHAIRESCFMQGMTPDEVIAFAKRNPELKKLYDFWTRQSARANEEDYSGTTDNSVYLF